MEGAGGGRVNLRGSDARWNINQPTVELFCKRPKSHTITRPQRKAEHRIIIECRYFGTPCRDEAGV